MKKYLLFLVVVCLFTASKCKKTPTPTPTPTPTTTPTSNANFIKLKINGPGMVNKEFNLVKNGANDSDFMVYIRNNDGTNYTQVQASHGDTMIQIRFIGNTPNSDVQFAGSITYVFIVINNATNPYTAQTDTTGHIHLGPVFTEKDLVYNPNNMQLKGDAICSGTFSGMMSDFNADPVTIVSGSFNFDGK